MLMLALTAVLSPFAIGYIIAEGTVQIFYTVHKILGGKKTRQQCKKYLIKKLSKF